MLASYVFAIRSLYEPIKDIKHIDNAQEIIEKYVDSLDDAYGKYAYDYTVHAHLHLADQVKKHGQLYSHSQFVFEVCFGKCVFNLILIFNQRALFTI